MLKCDQKYVLQMLDNIETKIDGVVAMELKNGNMTEDARKSFDDVVLAIREYRSLVKEMHIAG